MTLKELIKNQKDDTVYELRFQDPVEYLKIKKNNGEQTFMLYQNGNKEIEVIYEEIKNNVKDFEIISEDKIRLHDRKYKDYQEIQDTIELRRNYEYFNHYDTYNVAIIHLKFGNAWKMYSGMETQNNLPEEFVKEYKKYFRAEGEMFKNARDVVNYIVENNLPVILYANYFDQELNKEEVYEWLEANNV